MQDKELHTVTVGTFIRFLKNLNGLIEKGSKHVARGKISEKKLIQGKLAPDMFNFIQQVGYAYFTAFETVTNLTGKQPPEFTYDEKNIKELKTSIVRAVKFLETIRPKDIAQSRGKRIKTFLHPNKKFSRDVYVCELALPNFFFHVTTAYDIFRHLGVPLGKEDYLGV